MNDGNATTRLGGIFEITYTTCHCRRAKIAHREDYPAQPCAGPTRKMADALGKALPKMIGLKEQHRRYFVASISPSGHVEIRWDHKGNKKRASK
jgi:hypothetical protein